MSNCLNALSDCGDECCSNIAQFDLTAYTSNVGTAIAAYSAQVSSVVNNNLSAAINQAAYSSNAVASSSNAAYRVSAWASTAVSPDTSSNYLAFALPVGISAATSIVPTVDSIYDLGSSNRRFRSLYVSGNTIYLGSNALSADGTSVTILNQTSSAPANLIVKQLQVTSAASNSSNVVIISANSNAGGGIQIVNASVSNGVVSVSSNAATTTFDCNLPSQAAFASNTAVAASNSSFNAGITQFSALSNTSVNTSNLVVTNTTSNAPVTVQVPSAVGATNNAALVMVGSGVQGSNRLRMLIGRDTTNNNSAGVVAYNNVGFTSANNFLSLGMLGSEQTVCVLGSGRTGFGVSNPQTAVDAASGTVQASNVMVGQTLTVAGVDVGSRAAFASNLAIGTSNALFPVTTTISNVTYATSNIAFAQITTLGAQSLFASNSSVFASNTSVSASNIAIWTSNNMGAAVSAVFASNTAASASNVGYGTSNTVFPQIVMLNNIAVYSSNTATTTSSIAVSASNNSFQTSNQWYPLGTFSCNTSIASSNNAFQSSNAIFPQLTSLTAQCTFASNVSVSASNNSFQSSNATFPQLTSLTAQGTFASNVSVFSCNTSIASSNNSFQSSNAIFPQLTTLTAQGAFASNVSVSASNNAFQSSNATFPQLTTLTAQGAFASNVSVSASNNAFQSSNAIFNQVTTLSNNSAQLSNVSINTSNLSVTNTASNAPVQFQVPSASGTTSNVALVLLGSGMQSSNNVRMLIGRDVTNNYSAGVLAYNNAGYLSAQNFVSLGMIPNERTLCVLGNGNTGFNNSNPQTAVDVGSGTVQSSNVTVGQTLTVAGSDLGSRASFTSNLAINTSNSVFSQTATLSNQGVFASNAGAFGSNVSVWASNNAGNSAAATFASNQAIAVSNAVFPTLITSNAQFTGTLVGPVNIVDSNNTPLLMTEYSTADGCPVRGRRARGTISAPSQVLSNDNLTGLRSFGYTSAGGFSRSSTIEMIALEPFTSTNLGSCITLNTVPLGGNTSVERVRVDASGFVGIGTPAPSNALEVVGSIKFTNYAFAYFATNNASFSNGMQIPYSSANTLLPTTLVYSDNSYLVRQNGVYNLNVVVDVSFNIGVARSMWCGIHRSQSATAPAFSSSPPGGMLGAASGQNGFLIMSPGTSATTLTWTGSVITYLASNDYVRVYAVYDSSGVNGSNAIVNNLGGYNQTAVNVFSGSLISAI